MKTCLLATIFFFSFVQLRAQTEKIDTDRPGETRSPNTVPNQTVQTEAGFLRQSDKYYSDYKVVLTKYPSLLTKYGIGNRVELRLITELSNEKETASNGSTSTTGITNLQIGAKYNFLKERGIIPNTALIAHYSFPQFAFFKRLYDTVGGFNFRFAMKHTVSKTFFIGYNVGMDWKTFRSDPSYIYTFSPQFNINEKLQAYVEVFGSIWKDYAPEHNVDAGLSYFISNNIRLDVSGGIGLSNRNPDRIFSVGASIRF